MMRPPPPILLVRSTLARVLMDHNTRAPLEGDEILGGFDSRRLHLRPAARPSRGERSARLGCLPYGFFATKLTKSLSFVGASSRWSPWATMSVKPARSSISSSSFLK
jgi:hypothetical protein